MTWSPANPNDFSRFEPSDMLDFLEWFEYHYTEAIATQLLSAFVEGAFGAYAESIDGTPPPWLETLIRYRMAAQWTYQLSYPVAGGLQRNLPSVLADDLLSGYAERYRITPQDIANIPPGIRQAFVESAKFSLNWVKNLSRDARDMIGDVISAEAIKNRAPSSAIPLLERVLQRDLVAKEMGIVPTDVTPDMITAWSGEANQRLIDAIARRATLIGRTEPMRAMNLGALSAMAADGRKHAYVMPHAGSCRECRRLIDGRVFLISVLQENTFSNFGVKSSEWVAALPQHPQCRHSVGTVPVKFRDAIDALGSDIPPEGIVLQWYGLPGGRAAMESLELPPVPNWLVA